MKTMTSTIFQGGVPVQDGIDTALVFAEANRNAISDFISIRDSKLTKLDEEINILHKANPKTFGIIIGVIGLVLGILLFIGSPIVGSIIIVISLVVAYFIIKKAISKQKEDITKKETEKADIQQETPPQIVTHIGKIGYSAKVVPFEDGKLIVDTSGILEQTEIKFPEIPQGPERLKKLFETMSQIPDELPILLPATGSSDLQDKPRLKGIESDIEEVLSISDIVFSDTVDIKTHLPVYNKNENIVHTLKQLHKYVIDGEQKNSIGIADEEVDRSIKSLENTSKEANELRKMGSENVENLMGKVINTMDNYVRKTKIARSNSLINILNDGLNNFKKIYDYPLTRFYCPKCHQVSNYIKSKMPVSEEKLNEVSVDKLNPFYRSAEMMQLRKLSDSIKRYFEQARKNGDDLTQPAFNVLKEKLDNYEKRIKELAVEIEGLDPQNDIHRKNAILKYNTIKKKWVCQLCDEQFNDEEAQWARMLKVKNDLVIPIWDNLWLEKHDERNRIIREKELELRTNMEKESTQLKETDKDFTDGYRNIRNKLDDSSAGFTVSKNKLDLMLNFFSSRNILSKETVKSMQQYFGPEGQTGNINEIISIASQLQEQLRQEPETVFIRRSELIDYADEVRNAEKYFMIEDNIDSAKLLEDEFSEIPIQQEESDSNNILEDKTIDINSTSDLYVVLLNKIGSNKSNVIKIVSDIKQIGLSDARKLVETTPVLISEKISKEQADNLMKMFSDAGAEVNINNITDQPIDTKNETSLYDLVLNNIGKQKSTIIKIVSEYKKIGLSDARKFVETTPVIISKNIDKEDADSLMKKLTEAGAEIEIIKK